MRARGTVIALVVSFALIFAGLALTPFVSRAADDMARSLQGSSNGMEARYVAASTRFYLLAEAKIVLLALGGIGVLCVVGWHVMSAIDRRYEKRS